MKTTLQLLLLAAVFSFESFALAVNLDAYVSRDAVYLFEGNRVTELPAVIEKEEVFVRPLGETMTRYVFRSAVYPNRYEIAYFTIYKNSKNQLFAYMQDLAFLNSPEASFADTTNLNPNQWVEVKQAGNVLETVFYPGDLGEQKYRFEFSQDSISITLSEWEQWFGMIPVPITRRSNFVF